MRLGECAHLFHNVMQRELNSEQLAPMRQHLDNGEPRLAIEAGLTISSQTGYIIPAQMQRFLKRHTSAPKD